MVGMVVDRPMGENYLRLLRFQQALKLMVVDLVHNSFAIMLPRKHRASLQNFASVGGLGYSYRTRIVAGSVRPITAIQVKENDLMAQICVADDGPAAAIFRIAGMSARHHDFDLAP
jgi:hypothetical protein